VLLEMDRTYRCARRNQVDFVKDKNKMFVRGLGGEILLDVPTGRKVSGLYFPEPSGRAHVPSCPEGITGIYYVEDDI
jgi:hypothetical protein